MEEDPSQTSDLPRPVPLMRRKSIAILGGQRAEEAIPAGERTGMVAKRDAVRRLLEKPRSSRAARAHFVAILAGILASTITYILSTVDEFEDSIALPIVDTICGLIFTYELMLIIFSHPSMHHLLRDVALWFDTVSLIPFYLDVVLYV